jgi:ADP-heptose:LPS heptosyltransferase
LIAGKEPAYLPYVVLHPFASAPPKAWPLERFVEVAERLQSAGLEPMILAGPADDASAFARFQVFRNAPLADVKNLMSGASLFIGNDSGPAHIAAAFGVPVVVLFGPSNPVTWAPWRTEARVLTSEGDIGQITIDEVMAAAETLRGARARA